MKNKQTETKSKSTPGAANLLTWILCLATLILICSSAPAQNLFMSDGYAGISGDLGHIYKFTSTGASRAFASGLDGPEGVAFDSAGNLFVATEGNINKITPGGARSTFASGLVNYPLGLTFDSSGNLFAADEGNIYKFTPGGARSTFASGLSYPYALAFDSSGNLFVADQGSGHIYKYTPSGVRTTFASGLSYLYALAFDSADNLFVTNPSSSGDGYVYKFTPNGVRSTFAELGGPLGLAFDSAGNLFVADGGSGNIYKFTSSGVRTIFAKIPGLVLDQTGFLAFQPTQTPTPTLVNISTRGSVETGSGVTISGFIITGTDSKQVVVRGLGPTLTQFNIPGVLADPFVSLIDGTGHVLYNNDNWKDTQQAAIQATGLAPPHDLESAILRTLQPGNYTAVLSGKNSTTGIGLLELYSTSAGLTNVSTRGFVGTGDNVLIGGFSSSGGNGSIQLVIRALGPTLTQFGVSGALADPTLTLLDSNGTVLASNDNWKNTQQTVIRATGFAPPNDLESAIYATLPNGNYTALLAGKNGATGVGLLEVYKVALATSSHDF
jgi:hypothetical protein